VVKSLPILLPQLPLLLHPKKRCVLPLLCG
jgi:hypothetical protein